jgi:hypothetical protein
VKLAAVRVGDGFSAGVIAALGIVLQYLALGREEAERLLALRLIGPAAFVALLGALAVALIPLARGDALLEEENFRGAFRLLEAGIERDQEKDVWLQMSLAARELDLPVAAHYHDRYMTALGTGGFWPELAGVVRSTCTVATGMRRIIRYCSRADPNPRWKLFDKLKIDEDLLRLRAWLETAFTEDPPADDVPGLWFGLIDVDRDGQPSFDMHLSGGHPDDGQPDDLVIGGSWEPRDEFAHSGVLDQIHKIAHAKEGRELENAEYHLTLAYGALAVRRLAMTLNPELLLGGAPRRVLAVGFHDGDSIGVGTLRPEGLAFPDE